MQLDCSFHIVFSYILICFGVLIIDKVVAMLTENFGVHLLSFGIVGIIQITIALVEAGSAIGTAVLSCHVIRCGR